MWWWRNWFDGTNRRGLQFFPNFFMLLGFEQKNWSHIYSICNQISCLSPTLQRSCYLYPSGGSVSIKPSAYSPYLCCGWEYCTNWVSVTLCLFESCTGASHKYLGLVHKHALLAPPHIHGNLLVYLWALLTWGPLASDTPSPIPLALQAQYQHLSLSLVSPSCPLFIQLLFLRFLKIFFLLKGFEGVFRCPKVSPWRKCVIFDIGL